MQYQFLKMCRNHFYIPPLFDSTTVLCSFLAASFLWFPMLIKRKHNIIWTRTCVYCIPSETTIALLSFQLYSHLLHQIQFFCLLIYCPSLDYTRKFYNFFSIVVQASKWLFLLATKYYHQLHRLATVEPNLEKSAEFLFGFYDIFGQLMGSLTEKRMRVVATRSKEKYYKEGPDYKVLK